MKHLTLAARILLGLVFTAAGLDGCVMTLTTPPVLPGMAGAFQSVFFQSHWALFVNAVELVTGVMLLANRFVPLALTTLAAVIANILVFHITMMPLGIFPGLVVTALWIVVALSVRPYLAPLLTARTRTPTSRATAASLVLDP
ncbi:MAG TPA: hypothetical protein VMD47_05820 [Candidatus Acidoferrales bacterium]|nr:hypothetical protein [Candidatus Acidoferrales bacterium]